ncbi:hypothetical protein [Chitinophaga parva]|uniref:hypothetical protein n=1 Tax=Chitinophaga parva TaxID=2169414 RepID=UPI001402BC95|nr:hypothetical protein [Chitinophaga parva]
MKDIKITMEQLSKRKFTRDDQMPDYSQRHGLQKKNAEAKALLKEVGLPDFAKLKRN